MRSDQKVIDGAVSLGDPRASRIRSGGRRDSQMITRLSGVLAVCALLGGTAWAGSMNGSAGTMPAFYDGTLFTINFMELPPGGEAANLGHNGSINTIYMCDACEGALPGGASFGSGIDAIHGDSFNPLCQGGQSELHTIAPQP